MAERKEDYQHTISQDVLKEVALRFGIKPDYYPDGVFCFPDKQTMHLIFHIALLERALFSNVD